MPEGNTFPLDTDTAKALTSEYDPSLLFKERQRSEDKADFVLKDPYLPANDLIAVITGTKGNDKILTMTFIAGENTTNNEYLNSVAITPENFQTTATYISKLYGLEDEEILYNTFTSEFPDKNTETLKEDGITKYTYETKINGIEVRLNFWKPDNSGITALIFAAVSTDLSAFGM